MEIILIITENENGKLSEAIDIIEKENELPRVISVTNQP